MKKLVVLVMSLFLLTVTLTASNNQEQKQQSVTKKVVIMGYNKEESRATWLAYLRENLSDIEIQYNYVGYDQFNTILRTQLAAGQGPDIMEHYDVQSVAAGYFKDLSNEDFISKYFPGGLKPFSINGNNYAIPLQSWFEGIYYNKEIFENNGLIPPVTWEEFLEIHRVLSANGIKPQTMGAKSWQPLLKQNMGLLLNDFYFDNDSNGDFDESYSNGDVTLSGNYNKTMKQWARLVDENFITMEMLGMEYDQAQDEFATGKAAMWESGPWALGAIKAKNPDLKFGMFPFPGTKEGPGALVGGPGSCLTINEKSKNMDAALRVLALTSTPEAQLALIEDNFGTSFLKGVKIELEPEFSDSVKAIEAGRVYAPWIYWGVAKPAEVIFGKELQNYITGMASIDEVLEAVDKKTQQLIKSVK